MCPESRRSRHKTAPAKLKNFASPPKRQDLPSGGWYPAKRFARQVDPRAGNLDCATVTSHLVPCSSELCAGSEIRFTPDPSGGRIFPAQCGTIGGERCSVRG